MLEQLLSTSPMDTITSLETQQAVRPRAHLLQNPHVTNQFPLTTQLQLGGWAGFAFPNLQYPVGASADMRWFVPKNRPIIKFQGNSAHSTGFWQSHASGVYLGGNLVLVEPPTASTTGTKYTTGRYDFFLLFFVFFSVWFLSVSVCVF